MDFIAKTHTSFNQAGIGINLNNFAMAISSPNTILSKGEIFGDPQ